MATYIIRAGLAGPVKIGKADSVGQRLKELQTGNAEQLSVLRVVDTPFDAEPIFHDRFSHLRIRGEWFEFDADMMTFVPQAPEPVSDLDLAGRLLRIGLKEVAARVGSSLRTVENWARRKNGPGWRHTVTMLNDPVLAPALLAASGREDLNNPEETIRDLARQVLEKHGPDHPVLQLPDVRAALGAVEGK